MLGRDDRAAIVREVIHAIKNLEGDDRLDVSVLRNWQTISNMFVKDGVKYKIEELMHGSGAVGTNVYGEVVAGSTTTFTLAHTPIAGTVRVHALGQRLTLGTDYTISGATITTVSSWLAGAILADYAY